MTCDFFINCVMGKKIDAKVVIQVSTEQYEFIELERVLVAFLSWRSVRPERCQSQVP